MHTAFLIEKGAPLRGRQGSFTQKNIDYNNYAYHIFTTLSQLGKINPATINKQGAINLPTRVRPKKEAQVSRAVKSWAGPAGPLSASQTMNNQTDTNHDNITTVLTQIDLMEDYLAPIDSAFPSFLEFIYDRPLTHIECTKLLRFASKFGSIAKLLENAADEKAKARFLKGLSQGRNNSKIATSEFD